MATTSRPDPAAGPATEPARPGKSWRPRRAGVVGIVALLVVIWFLPALVAKTPLAGVALRAIGGMARLEGRLTAGRISLGWLSPVAVDDLKLDDADGKPLASVPKLALDKTLLGLVFNRADLGQIRLENPQIVLSLYEGGSNLEEALSAWLSDDQPPAARPALELVVVDGRITVDDTQAATQWQLDQLSARVVLPGRQSDAVSVEVSTLVDDKGRGGKLSLELKLPGKAAGEHAGEAELALLAESLPLAMAEAVLRRLAPGSRLDGRLDARLTGHWQAGGAAGGEHRLHGQVTVDDLLLAGPWLGVDPVRLARLHAPCRLALTGGRLTIDQLAVDCDLGRIACQGSIDDAGSMFESGAAGQIVNGLARARGSLEGNIDVARLASLLPRTLSIREGTEITSGSLKLKLASGPAAAGWSWQGRLEATSLMAMDQGRQIRWDHPLLVTLDAHRGGGEGLVVDRLYCASDFLKAEGSGTPDFFTLSASHEFQRLVDELGRFVDLGGFRMDGDGTTDLTWKRGADGTFEADAKVRIDQVEIGAGDSPGMIERELALTASAAGKLEGFSLKRVGRAELLLTAGDDRLSARLARPVAEAGSSWPLELALKGDLARWRSRLPRLGLPDEVTLAGHAELVVDADCSSKAIDARKVDLKIRNFRCLGGGLAIDEPFAHVTGQARWTSEPAEVVLDEVTMELGSFHARARQARVAWDGNARRLAGKVSLAGDLGQFERWLGETGLISAWHLSGACQGELDIESSEGTTRGRLEAALTNLVATPQSGAAWNERRVDLIAEASYQSATDGMEIALVRFTSDAARLEARGGIAHLAGPRELNVTGRLDYDLEKVQRIVEPYLGPAVRLAGRESAGFSLAGPLAAGGDPGAPGLVQRLSGQVDPGWKAIDVHGFAAGPGRLQLTLASGVVRMAPLDVMLSGGRLHLDAALRLAPDPQELSLAAGPLLEQVRITPEMCNAALKYALPPLAGVTEAQGEFSVTLDGGRLALADVASGDAAGKLVVHSVEVGPGVLVQELSPLVQELANVITRSDRPVKPLSTARLRRESTVEFRLVDGRVYHRGLELEFPDVTVRTYGSVGLDQTLAMMAELPIPDRWIGDNPIGAALRGRVIRVPIAGTLDRPKINRAEVNRLMAESLPGMLQDGLRNELSRQLDRLLKPK